MRKINLPTAAIVLISFATIKARAQQLPEVQLAPSSKDSVLFTKYVPGGSDFVLAYSEENYWHSNREIFLLLSLKDNKWTAWRYYRKWRSSSDVFLNEGRKKEKYFKRIKSVEKDGVKMLLDSLTVQGFWTLPQDSLNQTRKIVTHLADGHVDVREASISDATRYVFQVEERKGGQKTVSSYAPEYFVSRFPDMTERKRFLSSRDTFIRWWVKYCD